MAQDRLFQLDYLRRKGLGRLAEILGPDGLENDLLARTVGLNRIARLQWDEMPEESRRLTEAFARGINAQIESLTDATWPVEFDLLDYRPEPFDGVDLLAIETEFRWYLPGRFPIIVIPELARRRLGDGELLDARVRAAPLSRILAGDSRRYLEQQGQLGMSFRVQTSLARNRGSITA